MAGKTAYHPTITDLVHTDLSDDEYRTHLDLGWLASPQGDEQVAAEAVQERSVDVAEPGSVPVIEAPAGNASLQKWQDYARAKGATDEDLNDKTRDELRELYA